jgi:DNA-binding NtrC family response regulator
MKAVINQKLLLVDELIQKKEFKKALDTLDGLNSSGFDDEYRAFYFLLLSEVKIWLGDYNIEPALAEAVEFYRNSSNNELFARSKYLHGRYLISKGRHFDAREVLLESYLNYKRLNNPDAIQRVLNYLAFVQFQTGAVDDAIRNLRCCVEINRELGRNDNVAIILRNIALVHFMSGALTEAVTQYQEIERDHENLSDNDRCQFFLTYSMAVALQGDIKSALKLISRVEEFLGDFRREKAQYYEYLGWIYNLDGHFADAEKALSIGVELSMKIAPESALISQIKRQLAEAYIGLGSYSLAENVANEALVVAEKINERVEIAACWRVFALVEAHRGNRSAACQWFKKAAEVFSLIGSRYELAVTRYLAACAGFYDNGERTAMLYLAHEYFRSQRIGHFVERIDKELSDIVNGRPLTASPEKNGAVFIAADHKTKRVLETVKYIARSDLTVLLTGPTGSGKDQLARYVHSCSGREGQFVTVNCAAIPNSVIESELFGHKKGAFTGASDNRMGLFMRAEGGTLYLNEIADATPEFQSKLLEVIDTKMVRHLGEDKDKAVNFRIVAATNHDLEGLISGGKFRADLYHRLNEIPISLTALASRPDDIPALASHFLQEFGLDSAACNNGGDFERLAVILKKRDWPGNVRELKAVLHRVFLFAAGDIAKVINLLDGDQLPERDLFMKTLMETGWNQSEAARKLDLPESTFRNRLRQYGIKPKGRA